MNISREIIKDLLPAYFSGEASAETRSLIEEYFSRYPEFERESRSTTEALRSIGQIGTEPPSSTNEKATLRSAKNVLRRQKILLALASTFTLNALSLSFSFEIGEGHVRIHWLTLPGQPEMIGIILLIAGVFWTFYFRTSRRVRTEVLG